MVLSWAGLVLAILVVDLSLSGDNALVIGAVASNLHGPERRAAIIFGGLMAIVLRLGLAGIAVLVLQIPYIQAIGGVIVFFIALHLVRERLAAGQEESDGLARGRQLTGRESLLRASFTILVADVTMSLDNVLAVAALSQGNYLVLVAGVALSMVLLLVASAIVAKLIERFPPLLYLAGVILAWTAGSMVLNDKAVHPLIVVLDNAVPGPSLVSLVAPFFVALLFVSWLVLILLRAWKTRHKHG
jgi:YjbE family integral membrane protein